MRQTLPASHTHGRRGEGKARFEYDLAREREPMQMHGERERKAPVLLVSAGAAPDTAQH